MLTSAFSFNIGKAKAAGLMIYLDGRFVPGKGVVFIFEPDDHKYKDLKGASIFAGSNDHKLSCSFNDDEGTVVCVVSGGITEYAGETGVIYLAGQIFYVTIPDKILVPHQSSEVCEEPEEGEELMPMAMASEESEGCPGDPGDPGACTPPDALGADVEFIDGEDVTTVQFVSGATESEVSSNATAMLGGPQGWEAFQIVGPIECG
jgi:hypothetical protein